MKTLGGHSPCPYHDAPLVQHSPRNGTVQQMRLNEPFGLERSALRVAAVAGDEVRSNDTRTQKTHFHRNLWFAPPAADRRRSRSTQPGRRSTPP